MAARSKNFDMCASNNFYDGDIIPENENLRSSFPMNLRERSVDIDGAEHLSAFCIVRKQSWRSVFGWVYYLEKKVIDGKKMYSLFGGGINFEEIDRVVKEDEQSAWAMVRELDEEIGTIGNLGKRKFTTSDITYVATVFGPSPDGRNIGADIFELKSDPAERIHLENIVKHREELIAKRTELERKLQTLTSEDEIERTKRKIDHYNDIIADEPIRIRRLRGGLWMHFRWRWPFFFKIRPNWADFSPIAAYALMIDARVRERKS